MQGLQNLQLQMLVDGHVIVAFIIEITHIFCGLFIKPPKLQQG